MNMIEVVGKGGISATVIADSISESGNRMTTMELEYHRYIHAEFMTHRMLSKNSSSSRAVPLNKAIDHVFNNPAFPIHFGAKQAGMKADTELDGLSRMKAQTEWRSALTNTIHHCREFDELGGHKQWAARPLEPFQMMKVVVSGTDLANFFWLRDHEAAQPEIQELARVMKEAMDASVPELLMFGEWHVPYIKTEFRRYTIRRYYDSNGQELTVDEAKKISASCCAQVSYRKLDDSKDKALEIFDRLLGSDRIHASPTEHQATPIDYEECEPFNPDTWYEGITHVRKNGALCSGNLTGWIQHRHLIPNNTKWD